MLTVNKAKCRKCQQVLESKHLTEVLKCKCGALGVSGGIGKAGHIHRIGNSEDCEEMSEYERKTKPLQWPW